MEFGFGEGDGNLRGDIQKFKMDKGRPYRTSLTWFGGIESEDYGLKNLEATDDFKPTPRFKGNKRVWLDGVGYVKVDNSEMETWISKEFPDKKINTYVGTVVVSWPLNAEGDPDQAACMNKKRVVVAPWIINVNNYELLKKHHMKGSPFYDSDLNLELQPDKPADFQLFQVFPQAGNLFKRLLKVKDNDKAKEVTDHIIAETRLCIAKMDKFLGREFATLNDLKEALGMSPGAGELGAGSVKDGDEVEDILGDMLG